MNTYFYEERSLMEEIGRVIDEFPMYELTNYGRVFNRETGRELILTPIQNGIMTVGMVKDGRHYRRSVKVMVARMFVDGWSPTFNTPIQLDGDKTNLAADNIMWRPRWFANMYTRQIRIHHAWFYHGPIVDLTTNTEYPTIMMAARVNGLLCRDIRQSIYNYIKVFPTDQVFDFVG